MLIFPIQSKHLGVMHPIGFQSSYELFSSTREISPAVLLCLTHQSTEFAQRIFTSFLQRCRARELDSDLNALVKRSSLEPWKKRAHPCRELPCLGGMKEQSGALPRHRDQMTSI